MLVDREAAVSMIHNINYPERSRIFRILSVQKYYLPQRHDTNWRKAYPNMAPLVEKKPQREEIYLSSDDEDENTVDSEINMETENDYIDEHVIKNETPEDKNARIREEEKSKDHVPSEDIPPDSRNGAVQGFLRKKDIR